MILAAKYDFAIALPNEYAEAQLERAKRLFDQCGVGSARVGNALKSDLSPNTAITTERAARQLLQHHGFRL